MKKYTSILSILILSCSSPDKCPELVFDTNEKITTVNSQPYTGRCLVSTNENKRSIQQYLNGIDHGKWVFYFQNGEIETKGKFRNGKKVGLWKYFYPNGKIRQKSRYSSMGERAGKWSSYDSLGNIISTEKF